MPKQITHPLGTFRVWPDSIGRALEAGDFWDDQIRPILDEADPTGWAIDLGANIGFHTVYLARRFRHVIAVEAHPATYRLLCENITLNGLWAQVSTYCLAAYDHRTTLALATGPLITWDQPHEMDLDQTSSAGSVAFVPHALTEGRLRVPAGPIDPLVHANTVVSLIKTDVQGCDLRALKGLQRTIHRDRPLIVFEYEANLSQHHQDTWDQYLHFFTAMGYTVTLLREGLWDYVARPQ